MTEEKIQLSLKGLLHFNMELFNPVSCAWSYCPNNSVTKSQTAKAFPWAKKSIFQALLQPDLKLASIQLSKQNEVFFPNHAGNVYYCRFCYKWCFFGAAWYKTPNVHFSAVDFLFVILLVSKTWRPTAHLLAASTHSSITGSVSWERTC